MTRSDATGATIMQASYTYVPNGLINEVVYAGGLGARVQYYYDDANRVTVVHHTDVLGGTILRLVYTYTTNDLVASLSETGGGGTTTTTFGYDARGRLTRELRDDSDDLRDYDWTYEYDAGGNRTLKKEAANGPGAPGLQRFDVVYEYDVN